MGLRARKWLFCERLCNGPNKKSRLLQNTKHKFLFEACIGMTKSKKNIKNSMTYGVKNVLTEIIVSKTLILTKK